MRERGAIDSLLGRARAGRGGCLVLQGELGIGKTALLGYAAERAAGMRVLRAAGAEPESELGYAALHRLLLPVLDRVGRLPEPQARGLRVVFGQASGPTPDRFVVALGTLSLLSEVAGEQPLLCLVDDAQWVDAASLDTFAFVARRLDAEPIAMALAARADEGRRLDVTGGVGLPLAGLDREAARALLVDYADRQLSAAEQDELLRATAGNPMAIREMAAMWAGRGAARGVDSGEPLPLTAGLQRAFLQRARRHGLADQRVLLLVAADRTGRLDTVRRAATVLGVDAAPLASGALDDLITADGPTVTLRHPLIRSAIYHGASSAERRAAHSALAAALEGEPTDGGAQARKARGALRGRAGGNDIEADRRAWHLGRAADGPDEWVAEELDRSAERSLQLAGPAAAAVALGRAAELSASHPRRARRLVAAAEAWWQAGDAARAAALLEHAERADPRAQTIRLDIAKLRACVQLRTGDPSDVLAVLLPVLPDALRSDGRRRTELFMLVSEASLHAGAARAWNEIAALAERLPSLGDDVDDVDDVLARLFRGAVRARAGGAPGLKPRDLEAVGQLTDPAKLAWAAGLAYGLGRPDLRRRLAREAAQRARTLGAAGTLAWVLEHLVADDLASGRFRTAEAHADEGNRLAAEAGQPNTACRHQASLALLAALCGRRQQAQQLAEEVLVEAGERNQASAAATAYRAIGLLDLAAGRYAEAMDHLQAAARGDDATHPEIVLGAVPDLVEAAARTNQTDQVAEPLRRFANWAEATDSAELRALTARCRALLTSGDPAEAQFRLALELHAHAEAPMELARTRLLLGEHLRRQRRRSDARPHLRAALETFRRLGASAWADRTRDELRTTGETVATETTTLTQLTPQELRIAAAVSQGATNREIAAQLFLSPRTVDYHLRKVFHKTAIRSRAELTRLVLANNGDLHRDDVERAGRETG